MVMEVLTPNRWKKKTRTYQEVGHKPEILQDEPQVMEVDLRANGRSSKQWQVSRLVVAFNENLSTQTRLYVALKRNLSLLMNMNILAFLVFRPTIDATPARRNTQTRQQSCMLVKCGVA